MRFCSFLLLAFPALVIVSANSNNCPKGCQCEETWEKLTIVGCDNELLLSKASFSKALKNLTVLIFQNVEISKIENVAFRKFNDLETIVFKGGSIGSIDAKAFDLPSINTLEFTKTTFGQIPNLSAEILEELVIDDCKLTAVPDLETPYLSLLNLANNQIKEITNTAFSKLTMLNELALSNNSISKMPETVFEKNMELNTVYLDNNPLKSFKSSVSSLEFLVLKSCNLSVFYGNANLSLVTNLDLSDNQIEILPLDVFEGMKSLRTLDLSNNRLVELDDDIFVENGQLDKVVFDNNPFKNLPKFQISKEHKLFQISHFSCNNCSLKSINGTFKHMPSIAVLQIADNKITNLDGIFNKMQALRKLDLSNNLVSTLGPQTFTSNAALEMINLSGNPLQPVDPNVFASSNVNLRILDVSNTGLTKIWSSHNATIPSMQRLLMGSNNLTTITVKDLLVTPKLKLLDLNANAFKCTDDLRDVYEYLTNNFIYPREGADKLKTHDSLIANTDSNVSTFDSFNLEDTWRRQLTKTPCFADVTIVRLEEATTKTGILPANPESNLNVPDDDYEEYEYDDDFELSDDESDSGLIPNEDDIIVDENKERDVNLAKASYILSVTTVFVLSALVVLTVAVAMTLIILRRNKAFNMHNSNLPRFKIPVWTNPQTQKKHSGSIYKPLSEDLSEPKTPIFKRYEFQPTSIVHNP